jgi:BMFP domain-containing protein YqiC
MITIVIAIASVGIALLNLLFSRDNIKDNNARLDKIESNCLTTLQGEMKEAKKDIEKHTKDLEKIFDKIDGINREVGEIKTMVDKR